MYAYERAKHIRHFVMCHFYMFLAIIILILIPNIKIIENDIKIRQFFIADYVYTSIVVLSSA